MKEIASGLIKWPIFVECLRLIKISLLTTTEVVHLLETLRFMMRRELIKEGNEANESIQ